MRTLSDALTAAQKAMGDFLVKIVVTKNSTDYTYGIDTTNRILNLAHPEQEWSQTAQVLIDNRDNNLTAEAFEGCSAVISNGYHTTSDEYSATAPLTVIAQKTDHIEGDLVTTLSLAGLFNMWGEQEATVAYIPDRINTDTVKTILDAIAGATLTCFNTYPSHTITYDTGYDDSIINAFTPKDAFSIGKGESRLSAFRKAVAYTKCKARVENDSGVATIHIFQPTITGTTYDYEYNDAYGDYHNFFSKSVRTRLVLPNKVTVMNHPDHEDDYTGSATDPDSYAALGNQYYTETIYLRCASNAECARIATAKMQGYQIAAEKGHGIAPMNVGQEVFDYVKITDSVANDTRIGNVGYLNRWYSSYPRQPTRFGFEFRFGSLLLTGLAGTIPPSALTEGELSLASLAEAYNLLSDRVQANQDYLIALYNYILGWELMAEMTHLSVTERFQGPQGANKYD